MLVFISYYTILNFCEKIFWKPTTLNTLEKGQKLNENGFLSDPSHNRHYNIHVHLPQTYMREKIYMFHFNYYQIQAICWGFHCISLSLEKLHYSKASTLVPVGFTS